MNKKIALSTVLLFSTLSVFAAGSATDFFKTNPDTSIKLPANQLYPRGQLFPFTFYSTGGGTENKRGDLLSQAQKDADQKQIIEGGVTMIGPQYEINDSVVADARKYKVKAVYTIYPKIDGEEVNREYLKKLEKEGKALDVEKLRQSVVEIVKRESVNSEIGWWNIIPEELRFWRKNDMLQLKTVSDAIRDTDPLKRPMFMYEPGHRNAKSLAQTAIYQNVCGKGMYMNYSNFKDSRIYCRWSIEQEVEGIKESGNKNSIPIAIPEMFSQPPENELHLIDRWVHHDVYAALIAGAKGVAVFSASKRPNFSAREQYLKAYLQICRELLGPLNLGHIFLFGEPRNDISLKITNGPATLSFLCKNAGMKEPVEFSSVSIFNAAYKNERYLFLASSANVPVSAEISGFPAGKCVIENVFNKKQIDSKISPLKLVFEPFEVKCIKLKQK
ncbi:MAG: hypothetical protein A2017_18590 [Lentisphaerae bacterium GWF2_44_16]|nr:MAG: hypothetical protein A2017_18590 [Lentisphaerae bacterium GWF2_44_16]